MIGIPLIFNGKFLIFAKISVRIIFNLQKMLIIDFSTIFYLHHTNLFYIFALQSMKKHI